MINQATRLRTGNTQPTPGHRQDPNFFSNLLEQERARRDWLASGFWGDGKTRDETISSGVESGITHHNQVIADYEWLIERLENRNAETGR